MPWKVDQIMDQRIEFAQEALHTGNFTELCKKYEISRPTGYKWIERYKSSGAEAMVNQSKRPKSSPNQLAEDVVCKLIKLKHAHPNWGPKKIHWLYAKKVKTTEIPSLSSVRRVLKKAGLCKPKRRRKVTTGERIHTGVKAGSPNQVWTVDFKGWWKGKDGTKVEPLTVRDEYSRKILDVRVLKRNNTESVVAAFTLLFEKYGLPEYVRSDNGAPFAASNAILGLSRFSAWLLALGIKLERGRPGCPQDNGAHERMHLDIYRELEIHGIGRDQDAFDIWREEFNSIRPHESLEMQTPDDVYTKSKLKYVGTPEELDYGSVQTRIVHQTGYITYESHRYTLSSALRGWSVAIKAKCAVYSEVWFSLLLLGHINHDTCAFEPEQTKKKTSKEPQEL